MPMALPVAPPRTDFLRREEDVEAAAAAEVDDRFAGAEVGGGGGVTAGEAHVGRCGDGGEFFGGIAEGLCDGADAGVVVGQGAFSHGGVLVFDDGFHVCGGLSGQEFLDDLGGSAYETRADGLVDAQFFGPCKARGRGQIATEQIAADHGAVHLGEAVDELSCQFVAAFAGVVVVGFNLGVGEAEGHDRAGDRAAGFAKASDAAAEGPGDAQSHVGGESAALAAGQKYGLGAVVALCKYFFGPSWYACHGNLLWVSGQLSVASGHGGGAGAGSDGLDFRTGRHFAGEVAALEEEGRR